MKDLSQFSDIKFWRETPSGNLFDDFVQSYEEATMREHVQVYPDRDSNNTQKGEYPNQHSSICAPHGDDLSPFMDIDDADDSLLASHSHSFSLGNRGTNLEMGKHFSFGGSRLGNDSLTSAVGHVPYPWTYLSSTQFMSMGLEAERRGSAQGEEGTTANYRCNPIYNAKPSKDDGLYHCPDPNDDGCTKAEKLKCLYDKHIDAHLKPYFCKWQGCKTVSFSSTACLLRHEREEHRMHGHGSKPYLCHFQDCERSEDGNGFPRRWNLFDHMKRVHDYAVSEDDESSNTSPGPSSSF